MPDEKNYITPAGLKKLQDEYSSLLHGERPRVVEAVAWAASNGDRSENADYQYGKKRLREIDRRLGWLQKRIELAEVVDPKNVKSQTIVFGATVTLFNEEDENTLVYKIVGEDETDAKQGWISWKSPVAKSLLGKKQGDEVILRRPAGELVVLIENIIYN